MARVNKGGNRGRREGRGEDEKSARREEERKRERGRTNVENGGGGGGRRARWKEWRKGGGTREKVKVREMVGRRETKRESGFEPRDMLGKIFYPFKVRPSTWPLLDHSSSACRSRTRIEERKR